MSFELGKLFLRPFSSSHNHLSDRTIAGLHFRTSKMTYAGILNLVLLNLESLSLKHLYSYASQIHERDILVLLHL